MIKDIYLKNILIIIVGFIMSSFSHPQQNENNISISLEHATTPEQIQWGLMQRPRLPNNHGLLIHFKKPRHANLWSFNCLISLSVAFIDEDNTIIQIAELTAYPELLDPKRPVNTPEDIYEKYHFNDPIIQFFQKHAIQSNHPVSYALEMNSNWFKDNNVKPGDKIVWNNDDENYIIRQ